MLDVWCSQKMTAGRSLRINFPINMRAPTRYLPVRALCEAVA